jgi:hypothetical protein
MLTEAQRIQFDESGFVKLEAAFSPDAAALMQDIVWEELSRARGVERSEPRSWPSGLVTGLHIRERRVFAVIGSVMVRGALDELLGPGAWRLPKRWGAFLVSFPAPGEQWNVPSHVWHADYAFTLEPEPLPAVHVFPLVSDVKPRGGGTLIVAGSHRVVADFVEGRAGELLGNYRRARQALCASHPWLRDLTSPSCADDRVERFLEHEERIGDVPVRVVELCGRAGDVVITHPWVLHCRAPNCADAPRLMRSKGIYRIGASGSTEGADSDGCRP